MYLVGIAIFMLGLFTFMTFVHVSSHVFLNPGNITIILMSLIAVVMATSSFKTFISGLNALMSKKYFITNEERIKAVELFQLLSKTAFFSSLIAVSIRVLLVIAHLDDLFVASEAAATVAMALAFGLIVSIAIFEPAVYILKNRKEEQPLIKTYPKELGDRLLEMCSQNGFTPEDILNATDIELKKK